MKKQYAKTMSEAAKACGVSQSTYVRWKEFGCPGKTKKGYDVQAIQEWREKTIRKQGSRNTPETDPKDLSEKALLLRAQRREKEAKAELARIQADLARGKYISLDELKDRDVRRIAAVKRGLLALPKSVAPLVSGMSPPEAEQVIDRKVRDLLMKFSEM